MEEYIKKDRELTEEIESLEEEIQVYESEIENLEQKRRQLASEMGIDLDFSLMVQDSLRYPQGMVFDGQEYIDERISEEGFQILLPEIREKYQRTIA